jgi:hypothetical protein
VLTIKLLLPEEECEAMRLMKTDGTYEANSSSVPAAEPKVIASCNM